MPTAQSAMTGTSPVAPPATRVSSNAPSGAVSATVDCCPRAVMFGFGAQPQGKAYGYDALSNMNVSMREMLLTEGARQPTLEYWDPAAGQIALPANKETRDGASWVSVPLGGETQLLMGLLGCASAANCTYEVVPATVAAVVDPKPAVDSDVLTIMGMAEGEASLKVSCRGKVVGYFHIWCKRMATIKVGIGGISVRSATHRDPGTGAPLATARATVDSAFVADLQQHLDNVYRQALIQFDVKLLGNLDSDAAPAGVKAQARQLAFDGPAAIFGADGDINQGLAGDATRYPLWLGSLRQMGNLAKQQLGSYGKKSIWVLAQPSQQDPAIGGAATGLGEEYVFLTYTAGYDAVQTIAHELGHALGLTHPIDRAEINASQYPEHLRSEFVPAGRARYVDDDRDNLMGNNTPNNTNLLYRQWKALPRE